MGEVPLVQLLGHRARRGRERKHARHVRPIPQRPCALGGDLGTVKPMLAFNQHDIWVNMVLDASSSPRQTSALMWSGDRWGFTVAPQLGGLTPQACHA